ncbi:MAG: FG-GAP-like repeat-containing protein [bacterium]|nr:FG-GAP-like repeat-containing protein [bacterium]
MNAVSAADLDADGDVDVLAASCVADTIMWFENDGRQRFTRHVVDDSFFGPIWVEPADLDGDHDQDVVGACEEGEALAWWENDGTGHFTRHVIDASFEVAWDDCAIGDFNHDGSPDVVAGVYSGTLGWWQNDGTGRFLRHVLPSEPKLSFVTAGDIDGDGWDDLVFYSDNGVRCRRNLTNGRFSDTYGTAYVEGAQYLRVSDIDRDGDGDIVGCWWKVLVLENIGKNQWGEAEFNQHTVSESFEEATAPWVGDFDADNDIDIVCASGKSFQSGLERISWWENKGLWSFEEHAIAEQVGDVSYLAVVDAGEDADLDLFSVTSRGPTISFWERDPLEQAGPPDAITGFGTSCPANEQSIELSWVDPPDDDLNKILLVRSDNAEIPDPQTGQIYPDGQDKGPSGLWCRNVDRGWELYVDENLPPETVYYYKAFAYDNSANYSSGVLDSCSSGTDTNPPPPPEHFWTMATESPTDFQANWKVPLEPELAGFMLVRNETGTFVPPTNGTVYEWGEGNGPGGSWCANYDVDLWSVGEFVGQGVHVPDPGKTYYYAFYARDQFYNYSAPLVDSTAPGPFPSHLIATIESDDVAPYFLTISDFDTDGDGDLVTCQGGTGQGVCLWENQGTDGFVRKQISYVKSPTIRLVDMNGDGDEDILYAGESTYPEMGWIQNDGTLRFSETHMIDPKVSPFALCAADFDGDGDADVLATTGYSETLLLWQNQGEEGFTRKTLHQGVTASIIKPGDVDGDGDTDFLGFGPNGLSWWINSGSAVFSPVSVDEQYIAVYSLDVGDMDGDGDVDFVTATQIGDVSWWENQGQLHFERHSVGSCPDGWVDLFVCDLDGDGHTDIFCKTWCRVVWWQNDGSQDFSMCVFDRRNIRNTTLSFFDMDRDGDLDVVGCLGKELGIHSWENTLPPDEYAPRPVQDFWAMPDGAGGVLLMCQPPYESDLMGVLLVRNTEESFPAPERLVSYRDGDDTGLGGLWCKTLPRGIDFYEDNEVAEATRYFYAAYAYDEVPNYSEAAVTEIVTEGDFTPPAQPTNLQVNVLFNDVVITWTDPVDADFDSVLVVRSLSGTLPWVPSGERYADGEASGPEGLWCRNVPRGEEVYVDSTAETGTTYWYAVYAYDEIPNYSDPVSVQAVVSLVDSDRDELPDKWETTYFGSLQQGAFDDFDGDSRTNLSEFQGGSNPADPASVPGYAESPWPAPRANGRRTACSPHVAASSDKFAWAYCPDDAYARGTAVIGPDGTIYVGAQCRGETPMCALSALTPEGNLKWQYEARGQLEESPSVGEDGTIYFGAGYGYGGTLHAINPDGSKKWTAGFGAGSMMSSPAIAPDGTIYLTTFSREMRAFSSDGRLKWSFAYDDWADGELTIGSDATIYFGTRDGFFYAVNPDGSQKWRFPANGEIRHSAAIGLDDTIYFGTENGWFYALSPLGSPVWTVEHGLAVTTSPAIRADGTIFYVSGGDLFARRNDGYLKWNIECSPCDSDPTVDATGRIYLASSGNVLIVSPDGESKTYLRPGGYSGVAIDADGSLFAVGESMTAILNREDSDTDGLPDAWEREHFDDLAQDAASDPDNDSVTNLEEYRTRTDPAVPQYGRWFDMLRIPGRNYSPCVTTDQAGYPIIAYKAGGLSQGIYVVKWDGERWGYIGTEPSQGQGIAGGGIIDHPSLTVDEFGKPILAWQQEVGSARAKNIFVLKWNGTKWVAIGDSAGQYGVSGSPQEACTTPVIVSDLFGNPIVAWQRSPSGSSYRNLYVKRWTGNEWAEIGVSDMVAYAGPYGDRNFHLVTDYRGHPVLTWIDYSSKAVRAKRWNGETWEYIGDRVSPGGLVGDNESAIVPHVALGPSGNPAVAWLEKTSDPERDSREAHMKIWNGTTWSSLGGSASGGGVSNTDMVGNVMVGFHVSGHPFVAWLCERTVLALQLPRIYARVWDGANWVDIGEGSSSLHGIGSPIIAADIKKNDSPDLAVNGFGEALLVYKEWGGSSGSEAIVLRKFSVNPDSKIRVSTPRGFQKGDVPLRFTLTNSLGLPMHATVEFSLDGGANWSEATAAQGSGGLINLSSSPHGVEHAFVWDSASDVDQNVRNIVRLRITATADADVLVTGMTSSFFLGALKDEDKDLLDDDWEMRYFGSLAYDRKSDPDFDRCPNILEQSLGTDPTNPSQPARTPSATVATPVEPQSGNVTISYTLVDHNADPVSIKVYYSEDGHNWYRATPAAGTETSNLASSRQGVSHTFVWNSAADLRHTRHDAVRIRITPFDTEQGSFGITGPFAVDNTSPEVQPCVIPAAADAEVRAQSPDTSFAAANLAVSNLSGSERRTYLRFDLTSLPQGRVSGCQLRMDARSLLWFGESADGTVRIRRAGAPWQDDTITWNNQPPISATVLAEISLNEQPLDLLGAREDVVLSWCSEALDVLVNSWVNGVPNDGLVLEMDLDAQGAPAEVGFYSMESAAADPAVSAPRLLFDLEPYPDGPRPTVLLSRAEAPARVSLHDNDELRVRLLSFRVEANNMEPLTVESLSFSLSGTMFPPEDILRMSLFVDVNKNGLYDGALVDTFLGAATSPGAAFGPLQKSITPGQSEDWLLVADFSGKARKGEFLSVCLAGEGSVVCRSSDSGTPVTILIEPGIEGACEIVSTSFRPGEFLVDDYRAETRIILKGSLNGQMEVFTAVPESNRNIDPIAIEEDRAGNVYVCMGHPVYKFSPTGTFQGEVYRLPDQFRAMEMFVVDHEDNFYFSADWTELYRARAGEKAVKVSTPGIVFDTIAALAVNEQNELFIADFRTGDDFSSNIYKLSSDGKITYYVRDLDEQMGAPYYVRSMTLDSQSKLHMFVQAYGGSYNEGIYSVEEDPVYPGDPSRMVFTVLKSRPPTYPNFAWIAFEHDVQGNTGDLYVRQNLSREQDQWALGILNVTDPQGPSLSVEGFSSVGRRLTFAAHPPAEKDSDSDGIPDAFEDFNRNGVFEPEFFETSPDDPSDGGVDFDGDGATHLEEYLANTDPTLRSSRLALGSVVWEHLGTVVLSWDTVPGRRYQVYYSDDPLSFETTWTACGEPIVATETMLSFTDVGDPDLQRWHPLSFEVRYRYYRVSLLY